MAYNCAESEAREGIDTHTAKNKMRKFAIAQWSLYLEGAPEEFLAFNEEYNDPQRGQINTILNGLLQNAV